MDDADFADALDATLDHWRPDESELMALERLVDEDEKSAGTREAVFSPKGRVALKAAIGRRWELLRAD